MSERALALKGPSGSGRPLQVLVVEDSTDDVLLVVRALTRGGYAPRYRQVFTEDAMRRALATETWDMVIADHSMPQFSSTAALVKAAIEANANAAALVSVANSGTDTGAGAVTALAANALTSGADGTDGEPYEQLVHGGWVYLNVTDSKAAPGATDTWYKHQLTLVSA